MTMRKVLEERIKRNSVLVPDLNGIEVVSRSVLFAKGRDKTHFGPDVLDAEIAYRTLKSLAIIRAGNLEDKGEGFDPLIDAARASRGQLLRELKKLDTTKDLGGEDPEAIVKAIGSAIEECMEMSGVPVDKDAMYTRIT